MKAQGSSNSRSSMPDSHRHVTSSSTQILKPTKASSSSGSNSSSPSASLINVPISRASPSRDEKLLESFERDDSQDNLIDFDKHGMTKFQHAVNFYLFAT